MSCCGQKRAALRSRARAGAPLVETPATAPRDPDPEPGPGVDVVEYRGASPIVLRVRSGRLYTFSPGRRARGVPASDAAQLLRNPLFRLEERRSNGTDQEGTRHPGDGAFSV